METVMEHRGLLKKERLPKTLEALRLKTLAGLRLNLMLLKTLAVLGMGLVLALILQLVLVLVLQLVLQLALMLQLNLLRLKTLAALRLNLLRLKVLQQQPIRRPLELKALKQDPRADLTPRQPFQLIKTYILLDLLVYLLSFPQILKKLHKL